MIGPDYEQIRANPKDLVNFELVKRNNMHQIARAFGVPMRYWTQGKKDYILCSEVDCEHHGQMRWALDEEGSFISDPEDWTILCGMHFFERIKVWTLTHQSA